MNKVAQSILWLSTLAMISFFVAIVASTIWPDPLIHHLDQLGNMLDGPWASYILAISFLVFQVIEWKLEKKGHDAPSKIASALSVIPLVLLIMQVYLHH